MLNMRNIFFALIFPMAFLAVGCSSIIDANKQKASMMRAYSRGDNDAVIANISRRLDPDRRSSTVGSGDELMWRLEAGAIFFVADRFEESIREFDTAEQLIEEFDARAVVSARDVGAEAAVLFTNLNALPYRGLCRDRIMVPIFRAFAHLAQEDETGFRVELFRLRENQQKVQEHFRSLFEQESAQVAAARQQNPGAARDIDRRLATAETPVNASPAAGDTPRTNNRSFDAGWAQVKQVAHQGYGGFLNPLGIFLSGYGYLRDGDNENAHVDFARLYQAMPEHPMVQGHYKAVLELSGRDIPEELQEVAAPDFPLDRDNVLVVFANGRGATFRQIGIYFPIMTAWPMCEFHDAPYSFLGVTADGQRLRTLTIADMDGILAQEFDDRLPGIITRIVLSTAIKEASKFAATYAVGRQNVFAGLGVFLGASIYTALMNTADTRNWEIMPKEFQIVQFPMPADHTVTLSFDGHGAAGETIILPENSRSAIIYVNAPSSRAVSYKVMSFTSK